MDRTTKAFCRALRKELDMIESCSEKMVGESDYNICKALAVERLDSAYNLQNLADQLANKLMNKPMAGTNFGAKYNE